MSTDELYLEPDGEPEFLSDKPLRESIRVKRAPDAAAIGRGNLRNSGKMVVILYEDLQDYKAKTQAIAGAGDYFAEYCIDGRTQKTWPFRIDARPASEAGKSFEPLRTQADNEANERLARIERALFPRYGERPRNRARRIGRALRRERQASAAEPINDLVATITAVRSLESAARPPQTENIAEVVRREVREAVAEFEPQREAEPVNIEKHVLTAALEDPRLRERLSSGLSRWIDPDSTPQKHWAVELGEVVFDHADKLPLLAQTFGSLIGSLFPRRASQPVTPPQPPAQIAAPPSPTQQPVAEAPRTFEQEADQSFSFILEQCRDNAPVGKSARTVVWLLETFPDESKGLETVLQQPGAVICQMLAAQLPSSAPIVQLSHAPAWFDSLKDAIAKRRNVKAVAPSAPTVTNNGNNSQTAQAASA